MAVTNDDIVVCIAILLFIFGKVLSSANDVADDDDHLI